MEENNLLEANREKSTVSARVNKLVVDKYKENEIPVSLVIESSLIHFMKLPDKDKIRFISENLPENSYESELKEPKRKWNDLLRDYFERFNVPNSVTKNLLTGVAVGAVALIGGILASSLLKDEDNERRWDWDSMF